MYRKNLPPSPDIFKGRIRFVYIIFITIAVMFVLKLVDVQIIHHGIYEELAEHQYVGVTKNFLDRGSIYFTRKDGERVSAATVSDGYRIFMVPKYVTNPEELYTQLAEILPIDREQFFKQVLKKDDPYEEIALRVSSIDADRVRALKLPTEMIGFARDRWRYYPAGKHAAQTIGFVAFNEDTLEGRYGLERYYEDVLRRDADGVYVNFFAQIFSDVGEAVFKSEERKADIVTTLEPSVQTFLDDTMNTVRDRWSAEEAGAVIIDPKTGAIRALTVSPGFDLNNFGETVDSSVFSNPLVEHVFEMGSIMKPLVMAMGLNEKTITPTTTYYDAGSVQVKDRTIYNFDKKARGTVTMTEVLKQSLNTGMVFIMKTMQKDDVYEYFKKLGFTGTTGIDLPHESNNLTSNLGTKGDVEYANVSFGQGIAVTPIAMARALATLAHGGVLVYPYLIESFDYAGIGMQSRVPKKPLVQVFDPLSVEQVTRMLVALVDTSFKSKFPQLAGYSIAAKTGTAQIANPAGGYYADRNLHSFFGYFPAYDPQYLVFFYLVHPRGARFSSETLSSLFMETAEFLINYYDIPPDRIAVE